MILRFLYWQFLAVLFKTALSFYVKNERSLINTGGNKSHLSFNVWFLFRLTLRVIMMSHTSQWQTKVVMRKPFHTVTNLAATLATKSVIESNDVLDCNNFFHLLCKNAWFFLQLFGLFCWLNHRILNCACPSVHLIELRSCHLRKVQNYCRCRSKLKICVVSEGFYCLQFLRITPRILRSYICRTTFDRIQFHWHVMWWGLRFMEIRPM